jgi:hypothetical protein
MPDDEILSEESRSSESEPDTDDSFITSDDGIDSESGSSDGSSEDSDGSGSDSGAHSTRSKVDATAQAIMDAPPMSYRTPGQKRLADVIEKYSGLITEAYKPKAGGTKPSAKKTSSS